MKKRKIDISKLSQTSHMTTAALKLLCYLQRKNPRKRLPSNFDLADALGISPRSVTNAKKLLSDANIVEFKKHPGKNPSYFRFNV